MAVRPRVILIATAVAALAVFAVVQDRVTPAGARRYAALHDDADPTYVAALGHATVPYRLIARSADVGFVTPRDRRHAAEIVTEIQGEQTAAERQVAHRPEGHQRRHAQRGEEEFPTIYARFPARYSMRSILLITPTRSSRSRIRSVARPAAIESRLRPKVDWWT